MRLPRPAVSVRTRLTVLYGTLFLASGVVLLAITYILLANRLHSPTYYVSAKTSAGGQVRIARGVQAIGTAQHPRNAAGIPEQAKATFEQVREAAAQQRADSLHTLVEESGVALLIMVFASMGLGWLVSGRVLRPLRAMTTSAQQLSEHNLHERLPAAGPRDEMYDLATTFNALLGRLEKAFDSQRQFVANASHELRTPLTLERATVEVALADPHADANTLRAACERVLNIGATQEALIEALLTLARSERGLEERHDVDLADIARGAVDASCPDAAARAIRIDADLERTTVAGDSRLLERLITNLLSNAVRYNHSDGWVHLRTATDGGRATLHVTNSGPVVPADEVDRLLLPFERMGQERTGYGRGLGLGLSIVRAIADAHDAVLGVRAQPSGGLTVDVVFPNTYRY